MAADVGEVVAGADAVAELVADGALDGETTDRGPSAIGTGVFGRLLEHPVSNINEHVTAVSNLKFFIDITFR